MAAVAAGPDLSDARSRAGVHTFSVAKYPGQSPFQRFCVLHAKPRDKRRARNALIFATAPRPVTFPAPGLRPVAPAPPAWHPVPMPRRLAFVLSLLAAPAAPGQGQGQGLMLPFDATGRAAYETALDMAAATLANALVLSRDAAWEAGTRPIPPHIREALLAWYPAELLDSIEYRTGVAEDATLQSLSIRYGDATAVAIIDTIIFANAWDAENNVALWAHEVKHVEQFNRWGLVGFARRYVRDHAAVEAEAYAIGATVQAIHGGG